MAESVGTSLQRQNIVYDKDGNAYIPASQRPDGTWRKAKRVKPGYIPPDEVPVYKSKGKLMSQDISPGTDTSHIEAGMLSLSVSSQDEGEQGLTRAQKKYLKKKEKKKKMTTGFVFEIEEEISPVPVKRNIEIPTQVSVCSDTTSPLPDTESLPVVNKEMEQEDLHKRIRTIKKKLKQIADLESKIATGSITSPDQNQLQKLARKDEYQRELDKLML